MSELYLLGALAAAALIAWAFFSPADLTTDD